MSPYNLRDPEAAADAARVAAGVAGPFDVTGSGERIVRLHLDGSANELPAVGDLVFAHDAALSGQRLRVEPAMTNIVGRVTSVAHHYELGPIALAAVRVGLAASTPLIVEAAGRHIAAAQFS